MLIGLIVFCEIMFWVFLVAGLCVRYILRKQRLGAILLIFSPCVDLVLLVVAAIDLYGGGEANFLHAVSAIYLGMSLVHGKRIVSWVDVRFAHKFDVAALPVPPSKQGKAHAQAERKGWMRHLLMFVISCAIMCALAFVSGNTTAIELFQKVMGTWLIILLIDFMISFSYTIHPRKKLLKQEGYAKGH